MNPEQLKKILEAVMMTADSAMNINNLLTLFDKDPEQPEKSDIRDALNQLQEDYDGHGIELKEVASGFRFQVRQEYSEWVNRLFEEKPQRYSRALLETLAIIAYRQPITRGEIENIRGVSVNSNITKTLQEREWIKVVGHRDVPGKPELLATTREFLDHFNLKKLSDLPSLSEIMDFENINPDMFDGLENDNKDETGDQASDEAGPSSEEATVDNTDPESIATVLEVVADDISSEDVDESSLLDETVEETIVPAESIDEDYIDLEVAEDVSTTEDDAENNVIPFSG